MRPLRSPGSNHRTAHADAIVECGFAPEHFAKCASRYCGNAIGPQSRISVLAKVHLLIVLAQPAPSASRQVRWAWRDASFSPRPPVMRLTWSSCATVVYTSKLLAIQSKPVSDPP